jgi:hypothetical protein
VMPIGQAGERDNLRDSTRIERDSLMRARSSIPSWPAAGRRAHRPDLIGTKRIVGRVTASQRHRLHRSCCA